MKNNTNIYDIDGELLRKADDNHEMTIEEAQERMKNYGKKAEEHPEKAEIYKTYIKNLSNYVFNKISQMSSDEFTEYVKKISPKVETSKEDIEKALNDVKESINDGETAEDTTDEVPTEHTGDNESNANEELGDAEIIERNDSDIHAQRTITQDDLLVEREGVKDTPMDEYVEYTEE